MDALSESLGRTPEFFPYAVDRHRDGVSFIRLSRAEYDKASFLDARILDPGTPPRTLPWSSVTRLIDAARLEERCNFIFHIGHVGSTLLSRLVGAHPRAFALREPAILRTFAQWQAGADHSPGAWSDADVASRLSVCLRLLSRTFAAEQRAVVKTTSFVAELAAALLARPSAPAAVMLYAPPESYLATIFGGPNSRQEARILTPDRLRRLHRRIGHEVWPIASLSEGEAVAVGWICEMSALSLAGPAEHRIMRVDFDRFLAAAPDYLLAVLPHLGIPSTEREVHEILAGPHLHRYSKAPEYAYDAALRSEVLNEARTTHAAEIKRGLKWLARAASEFKLIRDALHFAGHTT